MTSKLKKMSILMTFLEFKISFVFLIIISHKLPFSIQFLKISDSFECIYMSKLKKSANYGQKMTSIICSFQQEKCLDRGNSTSFFPPLSRLKYSTSKKPQSTKVTHSLQVYPLEGRIVLFPGLVTLGSLDTSYFYTKDNTLNFRDKS